VGAIAVTGVFAAMAAHASHTTTSATSVTASVSHAEASGLTAAQAPVASAVPSHVRSGAS